MLQNDSFYESQINEIRRLRSIINGHDPVKLQGNMFMLLLNIPPDIINQCWPKEEFGFMYDHFKAKYESICINEGYVSPNAIVFFFAQLSLDNREIFLNKLIQLAKQIK